jgi:GntR family transcriptional regulator, transcriptional repressor for pyruvate dehydrogenase complex
MALGSETDRKIGAFRPLRVRKVADGVIAVIVDAIRGGLYEPGERLPRERDLAAALKVSRAVVREAIGVLERAGIVSVRRGTTGGIFVATRWIPREVIEEIEGESYASMRELLEVRRILETQAALLAGARRTDDDIVELNRLVEMLPDLMSNPEEFVAVDIRFHVRLAEASANDLLAGYLRDTMTNFISRRTQYPVGHIGVERALENQRDTFGAIVDGTPIRIAQSIDRHLGDAEQHFLGHQLRPFSPDSWLQESPV